MVTPLSSATAIGGELLGAAEVIVVAEQAGVTAPGWAFDSMIVGCVRKKQGVFSVVFMFGPLVPWWFDQ